MFSLVALEVPLSPTRESTGDSDRPGIFSSPIMPPLDDELLPLLDDDDDLSVSMPAVLVLSVAMLELEIDDRPVLLLLSTGQITAAVSKLLMFKGATLLLLFPKMIPELLCLLAPELGLLTAELGRIEVSEPVFVRDGGAMSGDCIAIPFVGEDMSTSIAMPFTRGGGASSIAASPSVDASSWASTTNEQPIETEVIALSAAAAAWIPPSAYSSSLSSSLENLLL